MSRCGWYGCKRPAEAFAYNSQFCSAKHQELKEVLDATRFVVSALCALFLGVYVTVRFIHWAWFR